MEPGDSRATHGLFCQGLAAISSLGSSAGHLVDRLAICAAGQETILQFTVGVEFARQHPPDDEKEHYNAKSNQRTTSAIGSAVTVCHATSSKWPRLSLSLLILLVSPDGIEPSTY
jgi:hypothetical protein